MDELLEYGADRVTGYLSEYPLGALVQTPSDMGPGWLVTKGVVTGFDDDGYPIVQWDDGTYPGESWEDEDLEPAPTPKPKRR